MIHDSSDPAAPYRAPEAILGMKYNGNGKHEYGLLGFNVFELLSASKHSWEILKISKKIVWSVS